MRRTERTLTLPWRAPLTAAYGPAPDTRELTLVSLTDEEGVTGHGEAAPLPGYAGGEPGLARAAAWDMAEWDLKGRRAGQPVWRLLGATAAVPVEVNATIGAEAPGEAAVEAQRAADAGFRTVKVKVGVGDDRGRVGAVREAIGPDVSIRLDANGSWSVEQAVSSLQVLKAFKLELCEEPVHGLEALAAVAAAVPDVAIAADESTQAPGLLERRICAAVCLKVVGCGGISGLLRDLSTARAAGYQVYLASTLDGPLGIAAALHAAAVVLPDLASGLATLDRFAAAKAVPDSTGLPAALVPQAGFMSVPAGPGLGDGLLGWYA